MNKEGLESFLGWKFSVKMQIERTRQGQYSGNLRKRKLDDHLTEKGK